ncbi:protein dehydratase [Streptacidiphilus sp. PB12-B1b]|uniref:OB-fold domain-containing protein n=1 Tax=Streptacidiphilus sp. PB12-B1b TaxID=2705012 RepID=UPI001CDBCB31|nr:OB-fold domain-containing protein [Streptacidiphilus sp. PB12-B1b]QMU74521.1 protein dehydratase [Streptacidiphilus sp. PB12-B1b]
MTEPRDQQADEVYRAYAGQPAGVGGRAPDPVNAPMIRHWCEVMGETNTARTGADAVAPPAMLQVWTMAGLDSAGSSRSGAYDELFARLDADGCTSVVATDCEQRYLRPLRLGERVLFEAVIESVSSEKSTALGVGRFVTTRMDLRAYDEARGEKPEEATPAATHRFRILKYRPAARPATRPEADADADPDADPGPDAERPAAVRPRPVVNRDTAGFWEGVAAGELRFQRCDDCGAARFPWLPGCNACGSARWTAEAASGAGTVYSSVVVHHPLPAAFDRPYAVALVELAEGVRIVSNVVGIQPQRVRIGLPVELVFERCDDELTLPMFRPSTRPSARSSTPPGDAGQELPELRISVTRTLVVAGAIVTRDFQDVHHDVELARAKGSPDIFMNILTTNGLVGRYVSDWTGPGAMVTGIALRLGVPAYPGSELTFNGHAMTDDSGQMTISVIGTNDLGTHATATVTLAAAPASGGRG